MNLSEKSLIWPEPLRPGDKVALVAPSSPVSAGELETAVESLELLDLEPIVMPGCRSHRGYLSGSDIRRAEDLNNAFASDDIRGVFCLRGGYGSMRILPLLDYDMIGKNPKILVGYSDITVLHTAINRLCGFVTFHGPMPGAGYSQLDDFSLDSLKHVLLHEKSNYPIINPPHHHLKVLYPGYARGRLTGGNLSLLAGTLGSPYEADTRGRLLFIEEVNEEPYRLDRSLTSLALAGKFRDCSGIILGTFTGCSGRNQKSVSEDAGNPEASPEVMDIIREVVLPWKKPVLFNLQAGHIYPQLTLPMGAVTALDLNMPDSANISVL